jgi:hypothetical protein
MATLPEIPEIDAIFVFFKEQILDSFDFCVNCEIKEVNEFKDETI